MSLESLGQLMSAYSRTGEVRSIAVVGNAPMEPSRDRAAAIDGCDLVIRVNSFVLDRPRAEPCQGSRCDVVVWSRMVRSTPWLFAHYRKRLYVMVEPMRMFGRPEVWPMSWPADLGHVVARNDVVSVPLNDELGLPWREEQLAPTSGTTAIWLAANTFPDAEVLATGISFIDAPGQDRWEHQWGDAVRVGPEHRIAADAALLRRYIDAGRVTLWPLAAGTSAQNPSALEAEETS